MPRPPGRKDLTPRQKAKIIAHLEVRQRLDGSFPKGCKVAAALEYDCHRATISKVWKERDRDPALRGGSARAYTEEDIEKLVSAVPVFQRRTYQSTAAATGIPATTIQDYVGKAKPLRRATSHVKPAITDDHKLARVSFCLRYVERPIGLRVCRFKDMYDTIHIDEKWFYVHKISSSFILTEDESPPLITCANKRYIMKVMFLAAVARPRYDYTRKRGFDRKIGIFPVVEKRIAKRTTKKQTKGELVTEPVSVDTKKYRELLVTKVLPSIQEKWPGKRRGTIFLQQDNASPHAAAEAAITSTGMDRYGWEIQVQQQSANSPDLNVLDLGFFNAIQALQHKKHAYSIDSLIRVVVEAFEEMEVRTLEKCFLTLQKVMEQVMLAKGGNDYDLPRVQRENFPNGAFPSSLPCSEDAYRTACNVLNPAK